jgi:cytochrome c
MLIGYPRRPASLIGAQAHQSQGLRRLYGLPDARQTGYSFAAAAPNARFRLSPPPGSLSAMNSFELNKFLGAILGTCLILLSLNIAANALFSPENPAKPGYEIAVTEQPGTGTKPAAAPEEPIAKLLASATPERGEQVAKPCTTCHTFTKGGPTKIGPNLWGVVGRPKGSEPGYAYSEAMKSKGGNWTVDDLNIYLQSPRAFVPGTKMSFAGLSKGSDRANVIAYLNTLSDNPAPLPKSADAGARPAVR